METEPDEWWFLWLAIKVLAISLVAIAIILAAAYRDDKPSTSYCHNIMLNNGNRLPRSQFGNLTTYGCLVN